MMEPALQNFIDERAEQLAIMHLTRHSDLAIAPLTHDQGLDLLVTILHDQFPTGRVFGVQVKGRDRVEDIQNFGLAFSQREGQYFRELPFPICVFLFTMENDQGFYQWMRFSPDELETSQVEPQNGWQPLTERALPQIIDHVNTWYENKIHSAA